MDASDLDKQNITRDRAVRLFTYLRELAKLKTPVVRDLAQYDEVVWFHDIPQYKGCYSILHSSDADKAQDSIWAEVRKTPEPERPPIPSSCVGWLGNEQDDDALDEVHLKDNMVDPASGRSELLIDHPEISEEWRQYLQADWSQWAETHRLWKAADSLYFHLFSIHQQLKKLGEQYELVLGLGHLSWETPNRQMVRRHIITGNANLTFDPDRAKFELQGATEGTKLHFETEMIDPGHLPPLDQQKTIEALLNAVEESPWEKGELDKVLRSWIQSLGPDGTYSDSLIPPDACGKTPLLAFAPALILRKRTQRSQIQCLSTIIEQITSGGIIPSGVRLLCEIAADSPDADLDKESDESIQAADTYVYLPLATNEEQLQIVSKMNDNQGILVQGPPGTGKSHTIANLICHLLAQGKRVLVTSQTPRALRVLKEKIPSEIASLCVTLLGDDQAARQELEASVGGINTRYSEWNPIRSQNTIATLQTDLYEIKKSIADKRRLLREQREIHTYRHEVASYSGTAQQIAQRVKTEQNRFQWLNEEIREATPCPLSNAEFAELLQLCRGLSPAYCRELRKHLVARDSVPDVHRLDRMIADEKIARHNLEGHESEQNSLRFDMLGRASENDLEALRKAVSALIAAIASVKRTFRWSGEATSDVLSGNSAPWKNLRDFMRGHLGEITDQVATIQALEVRLPDMDRGRLRTDAQQLLEHLQMGGKLGWKFFAPQVVRSTRYIMERVHVGGKPCATLEQLKLLVTYVQVLDKIDLLWTGLAAKDAKEEGSLLLQLGYLQTRLATLEEILGLEEYVSAAGSRVKCIEGLPEPRWHQRDDLEAMASDIQAAEREQAFAKATNAFETSIQKVRAVASGPHPHDLYQEMLVALQNRDAKAWATCLEKLSQIEEGRRALLRRDQLQARLNGVAPILCHDLQNSSAETAWDERATVFAEAWAWKQAAKWLTSFGQEHDEKALEADLGRLSTEEKETISNLAAAKAWDNCLRKLTAFQRNNLIAWATAMRRVPRTLSAKTRPKWLKEARKCMDNCRSAIPAWVMPLHRVFDTIAPDPECFDVIIIDEASQTGPEGLVVNYLAQQCIVVGDSEQISPDAVGLLEDSVTSLVERYLDQIPFKNFYHPAMSLFSFAEILFSNKIVLREHFRCMPEIIQFSNRLCYTSTPLKPLRQYPPNRLEPIIVQHVENGFRDGSGANVQNRPEADELVEAIVKMCAQEEYAGKTMGVISLQGEAQAKYIETKLLARLSPTELEDRRIVCGDAYAFQGDERDVVFLSMVAAPNMRIGALTREPDKRRFNVAASRSRDQLVLFHTATLNDLNPDCMRYKLLEYCQKPTSPASVHGIDLSRLRELAKAADRRPGTQPRPFDSWFEVDVCISVADRGFTVIPQYAVAEYRIDLVVEGTKTRLAIECDGDVHGIETFERDLARQRTLERCGWRFWRIPGYEYYGDPDGSLVPLWKTLRDMGIEPLHGTAKSVDESLQEQQKAVSESQTKLANESSTESTPLPPDIPPKQTDGEATGGVEPVRQASLPLAPMSAHEPQLPREPPPGVGHSVNSNKRDAATDVTFTLVGYLKQKGIIFKDKRAIGGALWIMGGQELGPVVKELKSNWGISFAYLPKGGKTSGHRPAWYSNTKL